MERKNLIPRVTTDDIEPKVPWNSDEGDGKNPPPNLPTAGSPGEPEKKKERSLFVKAILAFIIVGAIVGIGILLPIKLIPNASSIIATVFNSRKDDAAPVQTEDQTDETVKFTADKMKINSGESATISWSGPVRQGGEYSLQYPCAEGVAVTLIAADGTRPEIACGEPFRFMTIDNTMDLEIASLNQLISEIPLTFAYTAQVGVAPAKIGEVRLTVLGSTETGTATTTPESDQTIVVTNDNTSSTPNPSNSNSGTAVSSGTTSTGRGQVVSGKPDLYVRIIQIGKLDKNTGVFLPASTFSSSDRPAVQFEIVNAGTGQSGSWSFSALLPTLDSKVYVSPAQASLAPGGRTVFTLGFDNLRTSGSNSLQITADHIRAIAESNESNNNATVSFTSSGSAGNAADSGKADLVISNVKVGRMNGSSFSNDREIDTGDRAAVQFRVTNSGGRASGAWEFTVTMTDEDNDDRTRTERLTSLDAGRSTVYTVAFDDLDNVPEGELEFEIEIDSGNDVDESNERNNSDNISIDIEE